MIVVDSSGWIEYFTGGSRAGKFHSHLKDLPEVLTPAIVLYEVYKIIKREYTEEKALEAVKQILKTQVIPFSEGLALYAADVSLEYDLPMADAIVYATALEHNCKVVTMDIDFIKLPHAIVIR